MIPLRGQQREAWVDVLKAVGILSVIWIHAFCVFGVEQTLLVQSLAVLSRFAVPAFFFTSGFLQASSARLTVRAFCSKRLRRLLIPYLVASLAAILFRAVVLQVPFDAGGIVRAFAIGDAWGIYYFVPVLMAMSAVGELLFRFPKLALPAWILGSVLGVLTYQLFFYLGDFSLELRNPLRWFGWFAGGWALAVARPRVDGLSAAVRFTIAAVLWTAAAACYLACLSWLSVGWTRIGAALEYAVVCCLILGTAMMAWRGQSRASVGWLSSASYPIYLYHYFVVVALQRSPGWLSQPLAVFAVTLVASLAGVALLQQLLGPNATLFFGAAASTKRSLRAPSDSRAEVCDSPRTAAA